jgi:hypothetical protein
MSPSSGAGCGSGAARRSRSRPPRSRRLGVSRSTALRLLAQLQQRLRLARRRHEEVRERARPPLRARREPRRPQDWIEPIHPCWLPCATSSARRRSGHPANGSMVYIAFFRLHPVAVRERLGTVRPMHCSGLDRVPLGPRRRRGNRPRTGRLRGRHRAQRAGPSSCGARSRRPAPTASRSTSRRRSTTSPASRCRRGSAACWSARRACPDPRVAYRGRASRRFSGTADGSSSCQPTGVALT